MPVHCCHYTVFIIIKQCHNRTIRISKLLNNYYAVQKICGPTWIFAQEKQMDQSTWRSSQKNMPETYKFLNFLYVLTLFPSTFHFGGAFLGGVHCINIAIARNSPQLKKRNTISLSESILIQYSIAISKVYFFLTQSKIFFIALLY